MNKWLLAFEMFLISTTSAVAAPVAVYTCGSDVITVEADARTATLNGKAAEFEPGVYTSFVSTKDWMGLGDKVITIPEKGCSLKGIPMNGAAIKWRERRKAGKPIQNNQNNDVISVDIYIHW
jgi:hypothetical protein